MPSKHTAIQDPITNNTTWYMCVCVCPFLSPRCFIFTFHIQSFHILLSRIAWWVILLMSPAHQVGRNNNRARVRHECAVSRAHKFVLFFHKTSILRNLQPLSLILTFFCFFTRTFLVKCVCVRLKGAPKVIWPHFLFPRGGGWTNCVIRLAFVLLWMSPFLAS